MRQINIRKKMQTLSKLVGTVYIVESNKQLWFTRQYASTIWTQAFVRKRNLKEYEAKFNAIRLQECTKRIRSEPLFKMLQFEHLNENEKKKPVEKCPGSISLGFFNQLFNFSNNNGNLKRLDYAQNFRLSFWPLVRPTYLSSNQVRSLNKDMKSLKNTAYLRKWVIQNLHRKLDQYHEFNTKVRI